MKKILILAGVALLAYSFKDKIFGTSTDDQVNSIAKPGFNDDGTPRLFTANELPAYLAKNPGLKEWYDTHIGKIPTIPIGMSFETWANNDWLDYGYTVYSPN